MALGVAASPTHVMAPFQTLSARPMPPMATQVGPVLNSQPAISSAAGAYIGYGSARYGGSFGPSGASVTTQAAAVAAVPQQPMIVRRLNSTNSASSLSMQPPLVATASSPQVATFASAVQGVPTTYSVMGSTPLIEGVGSSGGVAEVMTAEERERVLMQSRVVQQAGSDMMFQVELESLRRASATQEERIALLTKQLQVTQENERRLATDLEAAQSENIRLVEEVRVERLVRAQAEAAATELRVAAEMAAQAASAQNNTQSSTQHGRGATPSRRVPFAERSAARGRDSSNDVRSPTPQQKQPRQYTSNENAGKASPGVDTARRGSGRLQSGKDEVDGRLIEFQDREDCGIIFRRLNRGWYSFRRKDEKGPTSSDRTVELSIVNGKLMARLEPSTHDNGWNNGKLGTIERFCKCYGTASA
jgi:hypothetical protein